LLYLNWHSQNNIQIQGDSENGGRKRVSTPAYASPNQLVLPGFETPFEQKITKEDRWVKLAHSIPWDRLVRYYDDLFPSKEGRPPISGRVILGAVIIKVSRKSVRQGNHRSDSGKHVLTTFSGYSRFTHKEPLG